MNEENNKHVKLPESLIEQLKGFENRLCFIETIVAIAGGFCGILITYAIMFLSDRLWDTPAWIRVPVSLSGGVILAIFAITWLRHWWWKRRDTRNLARLVQKEYSRLGDKLLGIVELANGSDLPDNVSPALCRAAIRQVAEEAQNCNFKKAVSTKRSNRLTIAFIVLALITTAAFVFAPNAGINAFRRWLNPLSKVDRFTFVTIEDLPDELFVPHGEPFEISCQITGKSRWKPTKASCSIAGQPKLKVKVSRGIAIFMIPRQTEQCVLKLSIGDVLKSMKITPAYRPELTSLSANIILPEYLQRAPMTNIIESLYCDILDGSKVSFEGVATRSLTKASFSATIGSNSLDKTMTISSAHFTSPQIPAKGLSSVTFTWSDILGLDCIGPHSVTISTVKDEPPFIQFVNSARAVAMLRDEVIDFEINSEDDFGIKKVWIVWNSHVDRKKNNFSINESEDIETGAPDLTSINSKFSFSPAASDIPDETLLSFAAYTSDYKPGRKPASSLVYQVYVLSRAKHAEIILRKMQDIQSRIDDIAESERSNAERSKEISKLDEDKLNSNKTTSKIKDAEKQEDRNARRLKDLAKEGADTLKEALRNSDIPEKTLSEWAEMIKKMQDIASQDMNKASKTINKASSDTNNRKEDMEKAAQQQKDIADALQKMGKSMGKSIKDMIAQSFINRFRDAAAKERAISKQMKDIAPQTIGISSNDLPAKIVDSFSAMAAQQDKMPRIVKNIQSDLTGFYRRTTREVYHEIAKDMRNKEAVNDMDRLSDMIRSNLGMQYVNLSDTWSKQFDAWADILENKKDGKGGDCPPIQLSATDFEILIALLRARQKEESIREQTRHAEEKKDKSRTYRRDATRIADTQNKLADDIRPLERKARHPKLKKLLEKVGGEMMNASMFLRKPQTDQETIAIETEIIELLSNCISSQCKQSPALAQMMMSFGMPMTGNSPGGNPSGGTTKDPNITPTGDANDGKMDDRSVEQSGGIDISSLPEEYRDIMEAYFKAIERETK